MGEAEQRTALITGASQGIGKAIAARYEREGYRVIAPPRQELDLSSRDSIAAFAARPENQAVDVLINNAAVNPVAEISAVSLETFDRALAVNLRAPLQLIQAVTPHMKGRRWGRIVNISSSYSIISRKGRVSYASSKSALNALTRTAALELASYNVLVNAVCPGFVGTEMTRLNNTPDEIEAIRQQIPLTRLADPDEIAGFVYFLGSPANTYITGQALIIDGGFLCQ